MGKKSNLTKAQLKGLKSLKARIENAEIDVLPTDKTGNFAIMKRETYLKSGMKHTRGDEEVGWEYLEEAQSEVNGHVSLILKIFHMEEWGNQEDRMMETMLGNDSMPNFTVVQGSQGVDKQAEFYPSY